MTKEIALTKGYVAVVDDEDLEKALGYRWLALVDKSGNVYARANVWLGNGKNQTVYMHRLIMGVTDSNINVDHVNGDGLDNRRANMRTCTNAENQRNRPANRNSASGVKGVSWHKLQKKWMAYITVNYKQTFLGRFDALEEAISARHAAAMQLHGEFARS